MTPFATFAALYMTALFLELAEKWTYPLFTFATLLLLIIIIVTRITRVTFLIFLALTTSHFLLVQFPDVANHVNIAIYCNVVMIVGIVYSLVRRERWPTEDNYLEMIRPLLQVTAILVYFLAGFHKLNTDFFDPKVSCVGTMLNSLSRVATFERLPVVEFRKLIYAWTAAGAAIPMAFEYQGRLHQTEDIAKDPVWRTDKRDWEMALMDFRVIQPDGANRCRW